MKKLFSITICMFLLISVSSLHSSSRGVNVLVLMDKNYGPNYFFQYDDLEQLGWNITTAGIARNISPCPLFSGLPTITVDSLVTEIADITAYDVLVLNYVSWRAGNPYEDILGSQEALNFITSAIDSGLVFFTSCSGPLVLAAVDRLNGVQIVGKFYNQYTAAGALYLGSDRPPVIDGNIVTSVRGQYYHVYNSQAIATALSNLNQISDRERSQTIESQLALTGGSGLIWSKTIGSSGSEGGRSVYETNDGGFIVCGYTYSFGEGNADLFLIKTDSLGNVEWSNTYGGSGWEYGFSACQTVDGDFIATGYTTSSGAGLDDVYVIKTNASGDTLWTRTIGGTGVDIGKSVIEMDDGSFVICGYTESSGSGESDVYLVKLSSDGNLLWTKTFGGGKVDMGNKVSKTKEGGLIIAGSNGSTSSNQDFYLIKTDAEGNEDWQKTYGFSVAYPFDWCYSVCQTSDGGYLLSGDSNVSTPCNMVVIKTDSLGNQVWNHNFGERLHDHGYSACETDDGGYILCGSVKSFETGKNDICIIKLDSDGKELFRRKFGDTGSETANMLIKTKDGNYVIVGYTDSYGSGNFDVYLLKLSNLYPKFNAIPGTGNAPLEVTFTDNSLGNILSWQWDFNEDGIIDSEEQHPTWTFVQPGTYTVQLIVSDGTASDTVKYTNLISVFDGESALLFNGGNSYVQCPATSNLNLTEQLTIEAWINPSGWGEILNIGFGRIVDKKNIALFLIGTKPPFNDHCLAFQIKHSSGATSISTTPENSVSLNTWQHVAVTYEANSNEIKMYSNGIEQTVSNTVSPSGTIADHNSEDLYIGNAALKNYCFSGIIDDVRIWSIVRSAAEIQEKMNYHYEVGETGLVGSWGMNEGNGDIVQDVSGFGNNGTNIDAHWVQGLHLIPTKISGSMPSTAPQQFTLFDNYPNPFNASTLISYYLPKDCHSKITIYNIIGKTVRIIDTGKKAAGYHSIIWDGKDEQDRIMSSGLYFYKLETDNFRQIKKMLLLK